MKWRIQDRLWISYKILLSIHSSGSKYKLAFYMCMETTYMHIYTHICIYVCVLYIISNYSKVYFTYNSPISNVQFNDLLVNLPSCTMIIKQFQHFFLHPPKCHPHHHSLTTSPAQLVTILSVSTDLLLLDISNKYNHTICGLLTWILSIMFLKFIHVIVHISVIFPFYY